MAYAVRLAATMAAVKKERNINGLCFGRVKLNRVAKVDLLDRGGGGVSDFGETLSSSMFIAKSLIRVDCAVAKEPCSCLTKSPLEVDE